MVFKPRSGAREKILEAADELAREVGPAHLVLDAVAARAGVSKGGLLYHFPAKTDLLQALVESHLELFRDELARKMREHGAAPDSLLQSYLELFVSEQKRRKAPPSGVLAAMVQNPEMLAPIKRFKREMLDRLTENARDPAKALTLFLALEGLRSLKLCDVDMLTEEEAADAIRSLSSMIDCPGRGQTAP
jgi:AcrR family transcriptional regulator